MFGNIGKMMKMLGEMKTKIPEMQARLAASEYQAQAGDGAVIVTVNGKMQLTGLEINPDLFANEEVDAADVAEAIKSAVNDAQGQAAEAAKEAMSEVTGGMPLPPGLDTMLG